MSEMNCIVIGAGRLGKNMAIMLCKKHNVMLIDIDRSAFGDLDEYSGFMEVGDALDREVLENCGIRDAGTVVIMTEDDNKNIMLADVCRQIYNIENVYIRLKDSRKEKLVADENVRCVCPFDLTLENFREHYGEATL
jgi:trk system potassium uptake protein TrkA